MQFLSPVIDWFSRMAQGGVLEIILLIVIIIVALILFILFLWLAWKLLVLLGKGLLWLFNWSTDRYGTWSQDRKEARLAAPPLVAVGWGSSSNIGLSSALSQARGLVGLDAVTMVIVSGDGGSDLCRSLGLTPPGVGQVGITAGGNTILIDASRASTSVLRRLANALPWRRPADAVVALVSPEGIPPEAIIRTAIFARQTSMRIALHFALPSTSKSAAWQVIDAQNRDGDAICSQLAADAIRTWLSGGSREGMVQLALAQSRELPAAINRALLAAPSTVVDITSLSFGGTGLRAAVAQTVDRTRPDAVLGRSVWVGFAIFFAGVALTILTALSTLSRVEDLGSTINNAARESEVPWTARDINTIPSPAKIRRITGLGVSLSDYSSFNFLVPLVFLSPNFDAPRRLASAFLTGYALQPLAEALDSRSKELLAPSDDPVAWVESAAIVDEWFSAWNGLEDDPSKVDLRRLFADAFGSTEMAWPEGIEAALIESGVQPPPAELGGLDIEALSELARENFVLTMRSWADKVYTNGPVATFARQASDINANWRVQYAALSGLREALQDPSQQWLTSARDKPEYAFEARVLGRAVGLSLFGQAIALRAKAEVSRIRLDARDAVEYFLLPGIGPIMSRSGSASSSDSSSVTLTQPVSGWLSFLDRVAAAGFSDLATEARELPIGPVTLDTVVVSSARRKLESFDRFASSLPTNIPPSVAQGLISQLTNELVAGVTLETEQALRYTSTGGVASEQARRLAQVKPAIDDLNAIDKWLRQHQATSHAERILAVQARVAETILLVSTDVLSDEDPVGIYPDPAADSNALVRRFERGVERMERIFEQYAEPFIAPAALGSGRIALEWRNIEQEIAAYKRGDGQSVLSGLEGMVRAYADDPVEACKAPRAALSGRDDYLSRTLYRFRSEFDYACLRQDLAGAQTIYRKLVEYFDRYISWLWPYAKDVGAAEISPSSLATFVSQLHEGKEQLSRLEYPFAKDLVSNSEFWGLDQNGNVEVNFRIDWRTRREEEELAEHLVAVAVDGAVLDEDGNYSWRYGAPLAIRMRLAESSPYRFITSDGSLLIEKTFSAGGNGSWLRVFQNLSNGIVTFKADVALRPKRRRAVPEKTFPLIVTARVTHEDGRPISKPRFSNHSDYRLDLTVDARGGQ